MECIAYYTLFSFHFQVAGDAFVEERGDVEQEAVSKPLKRKSSDLGEDDEELEVEVETKGARLESCQKCKYVFKTTRSR